MGSDGSAAHCRLKGLNYTSRIAIFGEAMWYNVPKTADLTKLDGRWRTAIWLGDSDRIDVNNTSLAWRRWRWRSHTATDSIRGTASLKCIKIIFSRAGIHQEQEVTSDTRVLGLYDISVAFWYARMLSPDEPFAMDLPRGEEEPGYMWQMKGAMYGTRRASRLFPEHTKNRSSGKLATSR